FNIRLLAELIDLGVTRDELSGLQTQLQLLDLYWRYRVLSLDGGADVRELALRLACEVAVTRRELSVPRVDVVAPETVSAIGQLFGPSVSTELARASSDFDFLVTTSEAGDAQEQGAADTVVRHIVGALMVGKSQRPLAGVGAGPWCELAERLSRHLRVSLAYS